MPFDSSLVGVQSDPFTHILDTRWAMNYAASIGDENPVLLDTRQPLLPVHPMYLAFPEWEAMKQLMPQLRLTEDELGRSVEMHHTTVLDKPLVAGTDLSTVASVRAVQDHRSGTLVTFDVTTSEVTGDRVGTSTIQALYRDVAMTGADRGDAEVGTAASYDADTLSESRAVALPATACHVYSECARIWNPFHTDISVAEKVGISGLILHGTATLARAVSELCESYDDLSIERVASISADLRAMVMVPVSLTLEHGKPQLSDDLDSLVVSFQLTTPEGGLALKRGVVTFRR